MTAYAHADACFRHTILKENMDTYLSGGALLALSGGKDSVLLLSLFSRYAREKGIPFAAFHLNHGIRGEEADADSAFCEALCKKLGVPLSVAQVSVPTLADEAKEGIEVTARRERYRLLEQTAREMGFSAVLTAHSATDNLETVLLHLLRGGGGNALCGIPPVRSLTESISVLRPLLSLSAEEIVAALQDKDLPFVYDSTNADTAYHRNYVREQILPKLSHINPMPERAVSRMTENLREDMALLDMLAKDAFEALFDGESLDSVGFAQLHHAVAYRVFRIFYERMLPHTPLPERVHIDALFSRLAQKGNFSVSFPSDASARRSGERIYLLPRDRFSFGILPITVGKNTLPDGSLLWLLDETSIRPDTNVYTLSTQQVLSSAKIEGGLYVRSRKDGDSCFYGGMTHKLKKMFSDRKIPAHMRPHVPILCDERGIVWVAGFPARDDGENDQRALEVIYVAAKDLP